MNDWRGTPIEVGSTIVYPTASSYAVMNEGVVVEVFDKKDPYSDRVKTKIRVRRTWESGYSRPKEVEGKTTVLDRIDRVTVVTPR